MVDALIASLQFFASTLSLAQSNDDANACGPIANYYGPFDFRIHQIYLPIVEKHHFTRLVEMLISGQEGYIGADIDYTLHAFPNHPRALISMTKLFERNKSRIPEGVSLPLECYFDRAIRFTPNDTIVRILYSQFLTNANRPKEALQQLEAADFYAKDNAFSHYNIGMAYMDIREYEKALAQAHLAANLGFERDGLAKRLKDANQWSEPPATPPAAEPASGPAKTGG